MAVAESSPYDSFYFDIQQPFGQEDSVFLPLKDQRNLPLSTYATDLFGVSSTGKIIRLRLKRKFVPNNESDAEPKAYCGETHFLEYSAEGNEARVALVAKSILSIPSKRLYSVREVPDSERSGMISRLHVPNSVGFPSDETTLAACNDKPQFQMFRFSGHQDFVYFQSTCISWGEGMWGKEYSSLYRKTPKGWSQTFLNAVTTPSHPEKHSLYVTLSPRFVADLDGDNLIETFVRTAKGVGAEEYVAELNANKFVKIKHVHSFDEGDPCQTSEFADSFATDTRTP